MPSGGRDRLRRKLDYLENFIGTVSALQAKGLPTREIIRRLDKGHDRTVKRMTLGNASFANMVRSALCCGIPRQRSADEDVRNISTGS